jgi:hypothetical protein
MHEMRAAAERIAAALKKSEAAAHLHGPRTAGTFSDRYSHHSDPEKWQVESATIVREG